MIVWIISIYAIGFILRLQLGWWQTAHAWGRNQGLGSHLPSPQVMRTNRKMLYILKSYCRRVSNLIAWWDKDFTPMKPFPLVVVVILFPEEYNIIHSIHTIFQQFHKCIPLAVAREALWLIELTTAILIMIQLKGSRVLEEIYFSPDVSSTLHSKYEWFNTSESNICL